MDNQALEAALRELPLYDYFFLSPRELDFSERVRWVCENECPRYGKTWACPPAVGSVADCRAKCLSYENCLVISTVAQVSDIGDRERALETRPDHEKITNRVRDLMREQGFRPYVLSSESCDICARCAFLDGLPCRMPGRMHPCVESHGINLIPTLEKRGLDFLPDRELVTWYSLLFF